jgi:splicing factor 45
LADWTNTEEDVYYEREKAQRGGRKKRKKNREEQMQMQDWDDIYDPTRPNNYEEYKHSDEKIREVREWKDRLYAHRMVRKSSEKDSDSEEEYKPVTGSKYAATHVNPAAEVSQIDLRLLRITPLRHHLSILLLHLLHLPQMPRKIQTHTVLQELFHNLHRHLNSLLHPR